MAEGQTRRTGARQRSSVAPEPAAETGTVERATAGGPTAAALPVPQTFLERVIAQLRDRVRVDLHVGMAFGPERHIRDRTIIPVAWVVYGYGAGGGNAAPREATDEQRTSSGGGGGGGGFVQPIAVIEVSDQGTRVLPIVDWTRLAARVLAVLLPILLVRRARK